MTEKEHTPGVLAGDTPQSEAGLYRSAFDSMLEGIQILGRDWRYLYLNRAAEIQNRRPNGDLLGRSFIEIWPAAASTPVYESIKRCMDERVPVRLQNRFPYGDGTAGWFDLSLQPVPEGVLCLSIDITPRKLAEERLESSERTLRLFVENAPAAIAMLDRDMHYLAASRRYSIDYRLADRDLIGRSHYSVFPEIPERWKEIHRRCLAGAVERAEDDPFPRADGSMDWVRWEIHPWYERPGVVGGIILASEVITERKQRERDLRRSEAMYRSLVESSSSVIATIDGDGRFHFVNRIAAAQLGAGPGDIIGKQMGELFPPAVAERQMRNIRRVIETNEGVVEESLSVVNGRERWYLNNIQPVPDASGRAVFAMLNSLEITGLKRAEAGLRESEEKYRLLAENISDVIWILDIETYRFRYVSPSVAQLRGYTVDEVMGQDVSESLSPASLQYLVRVLPARLEELKRGVVKSYIDEFEQFRKDGTTVWTETRTRGVVNPVTGHVEVYGASRDITERRTLVAQLLQAQKLESLGTLSSGIAHDFNNILGVIAGHASLLEESLGDPALVRKRIHAIAKSSARGADLVKQLLTFARKSDVQIRRINIGDVVDEVIRLLRETLPKSIDVVDARGGTLPPVDADPTQVHQVLLNLCLNAKDAMPEGGTLSIGAGRESGEHCRARYPNAAAAEYAVLTVADTGSGMDPETQRRMFEPFFTTKGRDRGTGLGLSMVFGIMETHGGFVTVESAPGRGSTFRCFFPLTQGADVPVQPDRAPAMDHAGGGGTVLLVEDEEMIRDMVRQFLESKGYVVLTAGDGEHALDIFREGRDAIACVISDLGLPGRNGESLFHEMKRLRPDLRFVLASGYFEPGQKAKMLGAGVKEYIQKPYDPQELLGTIHRVLRD